MKNTCNVYLNIKIFNSITDFYQSFVNKSCDMSIHDYTKLKFDFWF